MLVFAPSPRHFYQPESSLFDYSTPTYRRSRGYDVSPHPYLNGSDVAALRQAIYEEEQERRVKALMHHQYLVRQQQLERERRLRAAIAQEQAILAYRKRKEEAALRHAAQVRAAQKEKEMQIEFVTLLLSSALLAQQTQQRSEKEPAKQATPSGGVEAKTKALHPTPSKARECHPGMCGSAWYGIPSDKVYYEVFNTASSQPATAEEPKLRRRHAVKRTSQPQPQPQPTVEPQPKVQLKESEPEPEVDHALSRKSSLSSLGLIRAEYDLFKMSSAANTTSSPKEKAIYSAELLKFLERVDGVESDGDNSVRTIRRSLAKDLQAELDSIENQSEVAVNPPAYEEKKVRFEDESAVLTTATTAPVEPAELNVAVPPVAEDDVATQQDGFTVTERVRLAEDVQTTAPAPVVEEIASAVVVGEESTTPVETALIEEEVDVAVAILAETVQIPQEPAIADEQVVPEEESSPASESQQPEESQSVGVSEEEVAVEEVAVSESTLASAEDSIDTAAPLDVEVDVHSVSSESSEELESRSAESESDVGEDVVLLKSDGEEEVERKVNGGYELL